MFVSGLRYSMLAASAAALLAGCSSWPSSRSAPSGLPAQNTSRDVQLSRSALPELIGAGLSAGARSRQGTPRVSPNALFKGNLWVTDAGTSNVFKCTVTKCVTVGSGWNLPTGIATDAKGRVYVVDAKNARIVVLSATGSQIAVLGDPGDFLPYGVAVALDGTVAVTNLCGGFGPAGCTSPGNIVFYAPGSTSPTRTVTGVMFRFQYGAFDKYGNFFNTGSDQSGAVHLAAVPTFGTTNYDLGPALGVNFSLGAAGGVQVANVGGLKGSDMLLVADPSVPDIVPIALPNLALGGPIALSGVVAPAGFGLQKGDAQFAMADQSSGSVEIYAYPAGGAPLGSVTGLSQPAAAVLDPGGQD